jgi:5-histidylcysteine sulfoxide synthase
VLDYFNNTWTLTEVLFGALQGARRAAAAPPSAAFVARLVAPHSRRAAAAPRRAAPRSRRPRPTASRPRSAAPPSAHPRGHPAAAAPHLAPPKAPAAASRPGAHPARRPRRFSPAGEEPFYRPPYHNLRHPLIFYYAHPAVLYLNKLRVAGVLSSGLNAYFETIFETGVDEMSWDDLSKNDMAWPGVAEVTAYRRAVYAVVSELLATHPCLEAPARGALASSPAWAVFMAFEHERIHIETSTVLFRELPVRLVAHPAAWPAYHPSALAPRAGGPEAAPRSAFLAVPAGTAQLGKPGSFPTFGWDNEYGARSFAVPAFSAGAQLVCNGEFHAFVAAGGYSAAGQRFWSADGWRWRSFRNAKWPPFWVPNGPAGLHQYALRLPFDVVPMPWALPAIVNAHEARAYAAWAAERDGLPPGAYRLLTEPEHHRLRDTAAGDADAVVALSGAGFAAAGVNTNLAWSSESAVDAAPPSAPTGARDTLGSAWEWCEDSFAALPGFKVHPFYDDFSTPCFDGEHSVIMGASFASSGDLSSRFARFHFRPHFHQHASFRLARGGADGALVTSCQDAPPPHAGGWVPPSADPARRAAQGGAAASSAAQGAARALLVGYGSAVDVFGDAAAPHAAALAPALRFAQRAVAMLTAAQAGGGAGGGSRRALDIGAGVGALSFALADAGFSSVLGVEHAAAQVAAAEALRGGAAVPFARKEDATGRTTQLEARAPPPPAPPGRRGELAFRQMDPCCLAPDMGQFDAVVVNCVLESLPAPRSCLGRLGGPRGVVRPGGLALVACAHAWSEERTPREAWLPADAAAVGDALGAAEFTLVAEAELPALHREDARRFEVRLVHATLWRRTGGVPMQ